MVIINMKFYMLKIFAHIDFCSKGCVKVESSAEEMYLSVFPHPRLGCKGNSIPKMRKRGKSHLV